jgi:hypothetical protein
MLIPLMIVLLLSWVMKALQLEKTLLVLFYALLFIFINVNINGAYFYNHNAYQSYSEDLKNFNPSFFKKDQLQQFLIENGVQANDRVISYPDISPNTTLFYLNRKGWSETFLGNAFSDKLPNLKKHGAKWLIINKTEDEQSQKMMSMFDQAKAIFDNSIFLYDLNELKPPVEN